MQRGVMGKEPMGSQRIIFAPDGAANGGTWQTRTERICKLQCDQPLRGLRWEPSYLLESHTVQFPHHYHNSLDRPY